MPSAEFDGGAVAASSAMAAAASLALTTVAGRLASCAIVWQCAPTQVIARSMDSRAACSAGVAPVWACR